MVAYSGMLRRWMLHSVKKSAFVQTVCTDVLVTHKRLARGNHYHIHLQYSSRERQTLHTFSHGRHAGDIVHPALYGLIWYNLVTTKFMLTALTRHTQKNV